MSSLALLASSRLTHARTHLTGPPPRLPPYFVLIIRAFGLLEGLGLSLNRSFSVLDECFPLVARRLLTDDSPRVRAALRTFVYGASDRLSVERVEAVAEGMRAFTTTMAVATPPPPPASAPAAALAAPAPSKPAPAPAAGLDPAAAELLGIVFAPGGSYVQTLLLEEVARSVDALSRDALVSTWAAAQRAAAPAAAPLSRALGPAAWLLPGFPLLAAAAAGPPIRLSEADASQLAVVRRLAQAVSLPTTAAGAAQPLDVAALVDVGRRVAPLLPALAPGLREAGERLLRLLAQRALARLSADLGLLAGALAVR